MALCGHLLPRSSTEVVLNQLDIPQPISSQTNFDSVGNLEEQLFSCRSEITALHSQNALLRSKLCSMEKDANQFWDDLFDETRKTSFFKREATALATRVQFLEQLLNTALDWGLLGRDNLERLARELQYGLEEEDIVILASPSKPSTTLNDEPSPSQSTNLRSHVPRFLKPATATTIRRMNVDRCFLSCSDNTRSPEGPTAEQMKALFSFERLIAPLSTDLGSLETSSQESFSVYSHESSDFFKSIHVKDVDATLVVEQGIHSQLCKSSTTFPANTVSAANPKSHIQPVNTLQHSQRLSLSLKVQHPCSAPPSKLPKLSFSPSSTKSKPFPVVQGRDRTQITRQRPASRLANSYPKTTTSQPINSKHSQRSKLPSVGRNVRAPPIGAIQTNRIPFTTSRSQSKRGIPVNLQRKEKLAFKL